MDEKISDFIDSISKILFGILGSLLIGYIFFQFMIFNLRNPYFIFTTVGIYGSLFFSLLPKLDIKKQVLILISIFLMNIIMVGKSYYLLNFVRDFVLIAVIFFSIKAYSYFINKNKKLPLFVRSFALPVIYGAFNAIGIILLFLLYSLIERHNIYSLPRLLLINSKLAILVGFGLGLGFDSWEFIKKIILKEILL